MKQPAVFHGPLFIVGMPRSGTKLLRTALNQHPLVAVPAIETEFLPFLIRNYPRFGNLSQRRNFQRFYDRITRLPYFMYQDKAGRIIPMETWRQSCVDFGPAALFEALVRHDVNAPPGGNVIWGDKSPGYVKHITGIKSIFPDARFIHIVRDVRDYCLSMHAAWGKNTLRAAQRWNDDVLDARRQGLAIGDDYIEVRYEDVIAAPSRELRRICAFLEIDFDPQMLSLPGNIEPLGRAKGKSEILADNKEKFLTAMPPRTRARVEAIAAPALQSLGYVMTYKGRPVRLRPLTMGVLRMMDAVNLLRAAAKRKGLTRGLVFHWRHFRSRTRVT